MSENATGLAYVFARIRLRDEVARNTLCPKATVRSISFVYRDIVSQAAFSVLFCARSCSRDSPRMARPRASGALVALGVVAALCLQGMRANMDMTSLVLRGCLLCALTN